MIGRNATFAVRLLSCFLLLSGAAGIANGESNMASWRGSDGELIVRGRVIEVKQDREDAHSIVFDVKLSLEFVNLGKTSAILLNRTFWPGAVTLAKSPSHAKANKYVYLSTHWPSVYSSSEWVEYRRHLDQQRPPSDLTRIIAPGESFVYVSEARLYIEKAGSFDKSSEPWAVIRDTPSLWLQVTLEMWPVNVEPTVNPNKPEFGRKLQRRWRMVGQLQLERLTSEPMQLNFPSSPQ